MLTIFRRGLFGLLLLPCALLAQMAQPPAPLAKADGKKELLLPEKLVETFHVLVLGREKLEYKATAGALTLREEDGKPTGQIFFVAYTKSNVEDLSKRPILFAFNGGPGSSSVWLHLGAFGPRRVQLKEDGHPVPPPGALIANEDTLLDLADLVFIDPVSTGFSRAALGQKAQQFHGVQEDIQSVGDFIRLYCTRFDRWKSPKFLAGESYGTTRAAGLAHHLQDKLGMNLNGVLLISAVLNFQTLRFNEGNDLPYPLFLPSYTTTAWYHKKKLSAELQADLPRTLEEVREFALGEYTLALAKGDRLSEKEHAEVRGKLARYTGLGEDYVERSNLRIDAMRFMKELLRASQRTVGRYDSRFTGIDSDAVGEQHEYDPSYAAVQGAFTAMLNNYLRVDLKFDTDLPYDILTSRVQPWDYGNAKNRYLNVAPSLRQAMTRNRDLHLFVASGYYDLATPFFATDYTLDHLGLNPALRKNVTVTYYEAGHMMYIHRPSHEKLRKDIGRFLHQALTP